MGQYQPISAVDETAWLSNLVDAFARTEQLHGDPCHPAILSAAFARLQLPAMSRRRKASRRVEVLELSF